MALLLVLAAPARADVPLPYASLAPGDGDAYEQTATYSVPFTVTGAPALAPVYIFVSRSPSMANAVDFFGLSASLTEPGTYRGVAKVGGWADMPGTYWWQARTGAASGPVRRIVITRRSTALPLLKRAESRRAARRQLRRAFRSYRRGSARHVRCARVSRMHVRCRVSWRFRDLRYAGRVEVTAESTEELLAVARVRRSTRR